MRRAKGFTLIELITVIVILSVVSLISVGFVSDAVEGAIKTANRQRLAMTATIVTEQLSRELRRADKVFMPSPPNSAPCIKFRPSSSGPIKSFCQGEDDKSDFLFRYDCGLDAPDGRPTCGGQPDKRAVLATYLDDDEPLKFFFGGGTNTIAFEFSLIISGSDETSDRDETLGRLPGVVQVN